MPKSIQHHRHQAFLRQQHRCYYCGSPMWESNPEHFMTSNGLSRKAAERLLCTAEHLTARSVGGGNCADNIVTACRQCNSTRHKATVPLEPELDRQRVQRRVNGGRWLPARLAVLCRPMPGTAAGP